MKGNRSQRKQWDYHFSNKTGTEKRKKKQGTKKQFILEKKLELEDKRFELSCDINSSDHKNIIKHSNDEVIFEMNEDKIESQNYCIKILALCLNRLNIPYDISQQIVSYALGDIYIEHCIFQIMPDDILDLFTNKKNNIVFSRKLKKKYVLQDNIYEFIDKVSWSINIYDIMRRFWENPNNNFPVMIYGAGMGHAPHID